MATPYSRIVPDLPPWFFEPKGRYDEHLFESQVLKGNPLGDPDRRPLWVYLPPGYDADSQRRYPSIYVIMGLTGQIDMWRNRPSMRQNFPELADAQFATGGAPPCILVYVDAWTSIGGSQYVDSPGTGKYHTYLCDEIVPWVDARYRTLPQARHRGITGKSSGGYGAMITPMLRPDLFGGLATHAGGAISIDAGKRDQYFLDLGAEAFRRALEAIGVTDIFFELFDATHDAIEYRYPIAIKYLAERLTP